MISKYARRGKPSNSLSKIIFREINYLITSLEKLLLAFTKFLPKMCERISAIATLWHRKYISSNNLVISLEKLLLSRNFCQKCGRVNFRNYHIVGGMEILRNYVNCGSLSPDIKNGYFGKSICENLPQPDCVKIEFENFYFKE